MIRRILKNQDYKDILVETRPDVMENIHDISYFVEGREDVEVHPVYEKDEQTVTVCLSSEDLNGLEDGVLYRKLSYWVNDDRYPDGKYNMDIIQNTDVWIKSK